jgi:hypothetical protein
MNILVSGCSFSAKSGFDDPIGKVWHHYFSQSHNVENLSVCGQSNYKIFIKACTELSMNPHYDLVLIQWSSLHRLNFNEASSIYENNNNINVGKVYDKSLQKIYDIWTRRFLHSRIELTEFLTLIMLMAHFLKSHNIPYVFIKAADNFLDELQQQTWQECSDTFLTEVLYKNNLPDWEVEKFFLSLKEQYTAMIAQTESNWLNLHTQDWFTKKIDLADDNSHAGIKSNKIFFDETYDFIKTLRIQL